MSIETKRSPMLAPGYSLHRYVAEAKDTLPETVQAHGMNMAGHRFANIQVVPVDGANPDIKVLFWSEEASMFIDEHVALAFASKGVDVPYEFSVDVHGREIFVAVVDGVAAGQKVRVFVGGFGAEMR